MGNYVNITPDVMDNLEKEEKKEKKEKETQNKFDEKNYLNVRLDVEHGEYKKELRIRLLPIDLTTGSPFKKIKMHTVKVPKEVSPSGWKSYVCIKGTDDIDHEKLGNKCPFCELNYQAYQNSINSENEVDKKRWLEISKQNRPSETCIIRCIERGKEAEGPKFWKFNVRSDGKDPYNMMKSLYHTRRNESIMDALEEYGIENASELPSDFVADNIFDLETGKDLLITISAVEENGKYTNKTSVSVVDCGKSKPLSTDPEKVDKWVNDTKKWSDVFVAKDYDYLSIIMQGNVPFFNKIENKWVTRESDKEYQTAEEQKINEQIEAANNVANNTVSNDSPLPF